MITIQDLMILFYAGTFKLEMKKLPLLRLFDDKLNWARLMARSKEVVFSVEDATDATESGLQASLDRNRPSDDSRLEYMEGTSYAISFYGLKMSYGMYFIFSWRVVDFDGSFGCGMFEWHVRSNRCGEGGPSAAKPAHQCGNLTIS